jgi:hypothetical protein
LSFTKPIYLIKQGVKYITESTSNNQHILLDLAKLEKFLLKLRLHSEACGEYLSFQQLFQILCSIFLSAASLFSTVTILTGHVEGRLDDLVIVFMLVMESGLGIIRLYFHISMAVGITVKVWQKL